MKLFSHLISVCIALFAISNAFAETKHFFELRPASLQPIDGYTKASSWIADRELFLASEPVVTENDVLSAKLMEDSAFAGVVITFTKAGAQRISNHTRENIGKPLAFIVDGSVVSAPVINAKIDGGQANLVLGKPSLAKDLVNRLSKTTRNKR